MPRAKSKPMAAAAERVEMKDDVKDTFPSKAYDMIDHCDRHDPEVACWDADGTAFVVKDVPALESSYLPKKFDHSKFQSFVRQLNLYGFRNVSKEKEGASASSAATTPDPAAAQSNARGLEGDGMNAPYIVFRHDNFKRGRRDLVANIQRSKKGDRSQRRTRQEEELHAVSAALNLRFDAVDMEMMALHAKMDRLSVKLDKVLDLFANTTMVASVAQQKQREANDDEGRRRTSQGKKRRLTNRNDGHITDSMEEEERHSVGAHSTEDSRDAIGGILDRQEDFRFFPRNISPACSESNQGSLPPPKLGSSVTDESNAEDGHSGIGPSSREPSHDATGIAAAPVAGGVGHGDDAAAASELDDDNFLEACRNILEDDADDNHGYRQPDDDDNNNAAGVQHKPRGSTSAGEGAEEGKPLAGRRPKPSEGHMMDPEFGDLDALPLALDSFEGGSSSLSADEILTSIPGSGDLHVAAVFDHGNAAGAVAVAATSPPPAPVTVHYGSSDGRYGARRLLGHRTVLAGITLMSVIAAVAVGVMFSTGRSMHNAPASSVSGGDRDSPTMPPWHGDDSAEKSQDTDTDVGPGNGLGSMDSSNGSAESENVDAAEGGAGYSRPARFPSATPTPVPSSQRDTIVYFNSVAPSSSAPTIRF